MPRFDLEWSDDLFFPPLSYFINRGRLSCPFFLRQFSIHAVCCKGDRNRNDVVGIILRTSRIYLAVTALYGVGFSPKGTSYAMLADNSPNEMFWGSGLETDMSAMAVHAMIRLLGSCPRPTEWRIEVVTNYTNVLLSRKDSTLDDKAHRDAGYKREDKSREQLWLEFAQLQLLFDVKYIKPDLISKTMYAKAKRAARTEAANAVKRKTASGITQTDGKSMVSIWA